MNATEQIYVALLDEGIDVWRPVEAERLGPDVFRVTGAIPDGEVWAFQPGEVVRCQEKKLSDGTHPIATEKLS